MSKIKVQSGNGSTKGVCRVEEGEVGRIKGSRCKSVNHASRSEEVIHCGELVCDRPMSAIQPGVSAAYEAMPISKSRYARFRIDILPANRAH
jgi:hypothetical protein